MIPHLLFIEEKKENDKIKFTKKPYLDLIKAINKTKNVKNNEKNYNFSLDDFDDEGNIKK